MKKALCALVLGLLWARAGGAQIVIGRDTIPPEMERAYVLGLKFLVRTQNADGSWGGPKGVSIDDTGQEPGVVGLAVMAMLAHGDDAENGPYADAIRRAIGFIISRADAKTGQIGSPETMVMYSHGFAMLALAEAYGMTDEPRIGPTLQKAVDFLIARQKQNDMGAWRYLAESKDADTTLTGAQMVGLLAARNAGILVPDDVIEKGLKFYRTCQDGSGGVGYSESENHNSTLTAIGMLVYTLARQKDTPFYRAASRYFTDPAAQPSLMHPFYHIYYASQAAFHLDEAAWQAWNAANLRVVLQRQEPNGSWEGSSGITFSTAAALLSMALNYRYLPIYER